MTRYTINHSTKKVHWIIEFMREERVRQGLTQEEVCQNIVGHPQNSLSNYETGHYSLRTIFALEQILGALGYKLYIEKIK